MTIEERVMLLKKAQPNSWIAFSSDEEENMIAYGSTYEEAIKYANIVGETDPVMAYIPINWDDMNRVPMNNPGQKCYWANLYLRLTDRGFRG